MAVDKGCILVFRHLIMLELRPLVAGCSIRDKVRQLGITLIMMTLNDVYKCIFLGDVEFSEFIYHIVPDLIFQKDQ